MKSARRQNIRCGLLLIWLLLFPITLFYLSPYLPFMGASEGIIAGSLISFAGMFVTALLFGRLFCGWFCPAGALQDFASFAKKPRVNRKLLSVIKFVIWVPWLVLLIMIFVRHGDPFRPEFFYMTEYGISLVSPNSYIVYFIVIGLLLTLSFTIGRRAGCHSICWMAPFMILGRKLAGIIRIPRLQLSADKEQCIECNRCSLECAMSIDVMENVLKERMDHVDCILCGLCADVCPKDVISFRFTGKRS